MNRFAVLIEGFEHLSYPLDREDASDKKTFSERKQHFMMHRVQSELSAEMAVGASGALSNHACLPVGYVSDDSGSFFLVCRRSGKKPNPKEMSEGEKAEFSASAMRRLSAIHSQGLGCGGLSPDALEFSGEGVRLLDAGRIFAENEPVAHFFEAVSTLRSLASKGYAKRSELPRLAAIYLSGSPACREAVHSYMVQKSLDGSMQQALASSALKYAAYF